MADAIRTLTENPSERLAMGARGRERVKRDFTVGRLLADVVSLYRSIAEAPGGRVRTEAALRTDAAVK
jgi:glycosyltransferase involved in cell wall biosynthesis